MVADKANFYSFEKDNQKEYENIDLYAHGMFYYTDHGLCFNIKTSYQYTGPWFNIKTVFPRYGDSHVKDKTVARPSYLQHGDPYTGKTTSL